MAFISLFNRKRLVSSKPPGSVAEDMKAGEGLFILRVERGGPLLPRVKDMQDFDALVTYPVRHQIVLMDHELTRPEHPARPAHVGLLAQKSDVFLDGQTETLGGLRTAFGDLL